MKWLFKSIWCWVHRPFLKVFGELNCRFGTNATFAACKLFKCWDVCGYEYMIALCWVFSQQRFGLICPVEERLLLQFGSLFLRRRLGVQVSQGPRHPGRLANPRLIYFSLYFPHFLSFFTDMALPCLTLYSPRRLEGGWSPHLALSP
jgi:hypothetical protein